MPAATMASIVSCKAIAFFITDFLQSLTPESTPRTESNFSSKFISVSLIFTRSFESLRINSTVSSVEILFSISLTSLRIAAIFFTLFLTKNPLNNFWIIFTADSDLF
uniref:BAG family molecular chaperone regulator 6 n=1 Tax=Rhizophora mucronata TaxID=61149 RepID=A0A2P2NLD7_RHIMU